VAWRNLGRHRRRSVITGLALAIGFAAVVVLSGMMEGMGSDFIRSGTELLAGQIRVQNPDYEPEREPHDVVGGAGGLDLAAFLAALERDAELVAAAPRVHGSGIVATDHSSRGALLLGVVPGRERRVTRFLDGLVAGALPAPGAREALLGVELARQLRARVGDEIVVVAPAADGSLGNELFTVSGILRTGIPELDAGQVVLELEDVRFLLALGARDVHEVVATVTDPGRADAIARRLRADLSGFGPQVEILAWSEFRPELVDFAGLVRGTNWIVLLLVAVMAAFGVANTMLMGTFERRREFAIMKALGMKPLQIVGVVVGEALVLGVMAVAGGALLATPVVLWLTWFPVDLTAVAGEQMFMETLFRFVLRVEHSWTFPLQAAAGFIATAVLAALYPALRAVRVPAAEALAGR
jgi:ABC-type lipoprotein release transport system permease subunit